MTLYIVWVALSMVLLLALVQVASGHVLERDAETAADAAALAAASHWGDTIEVGPGWIHPGDADEAEAAAQELATQNDAELASLDGHRLGLGWRATAEVETNDVIIPGPVSSVAGDTVQSTSSAAVSLTVTPLRAARRTPIGEIERTIGLTRRRDSALFHYAGQTCRGGVDTDRLSDEMKIAILRVEAELQQGIRLDAGYQTAACLRRAGVQVPGLSPASTGDQIDLSADQSAAAASFRQRGFCESSGYRFTSPGSLACGGDLTALVSIDTRLVPNP